MATTLSHTDPSKLSASAARFSLIGSILALLLLASLHVLSKEYNPSFHMISEYANGQYGWVLSLMFLTWGVSTGLLVYAIRSQLTTRTGKIGLVLLFLAGLGQALAAVFTIRMQPFHDLCAYLSIPSFTIGAMLISIRLSHTNGWVASKNALLWTANLTWISIVLFIATFALMIATFIQSGAKVDPNVTLLELPHGVIGLVGYANRLGVLTNCLWIVVVAWLAVKLQKKNSSQVFTTIDQVGATST